ncbi:hypothetical protein N7471_013519 [Penicillium samsonianum]|uniref:uncharacterized protein n=1 Tax=Penicillium samsonianum TaxID=1882272 RepID=UPI002548798C|nr:uncharacterized protein N7471_013519 [Penicillium samsonianum]KAJ6118899.1 hypothetical protein N7471_013519 [Penicillium samsonianum]
MKIFGIGFSGYVGDGVATKLLADGHILTGLARSQTAAELLREKGITPVMGAIADAEIIHKTAKEADAALLLCTGGFMTEILGQEQQYVDCVEALISAFEWTGKPLMQIGGLALWAGKTPEDVGVLHESSPFNTSNWYAEILPGYDKVQSSNSRGVRGFTLLPGQVYGRGGGYIGPLPRRFEDFRKNGAIHYLDNSAGRLLSTHIDDLASAVALGLVKAGAGERYIVITDDCDNLTLCKMVSRVCGLDGQLSYVDKETLEKKCGWAGQWDFNIHARANSDKISRELGWKSQGLGLVAELQRLIDEKVNVDDIYPMKSRQKTLENLEIFD